MPYQDSEPAEGGLTLEGVWLHDPEDAEGTVAQFLYGRSRRGATVAPQHVLAHYAGRRYPVADFGDLQSDSFTVVVEIPNGPASAGELEVLADFAESRRTLVFRDNRGRVAFGTMSGYTEADQDWGVQVSFSWARVDYDEGELVA